MRQRIHWGSLGLALWAAVAISLPVSAQEGTQPKAAGKPVVEVLETSFDFGYVAQNCKISHVFWMRNTGGDTLFIRDVKPG